MIHKPKSGMKVGVTYRAYSNIWDQPSYNGGLAMFHPSMLVKCLRTFKRGCFTLLAAIRLRVNVCTARLLNRKGWCRALLASAIRTLGACYTGRVLASLWTKRSASSKCVKYF